jgi:hypothetical protein
MKRLIIAVLIGILLAFGTSFLDAAEMQESEEPVTLVEVLEGHRDALKYILNELDEQDEVTAELKAMLVSLDMTLGEYIRHNEARVSSLISIISAMQDKIRILMDRERAAILQEVEDKHNL